MAYITHVAATTILESEGSTQDWPTDLGERGEYVERASRRIDQLAFAPDHETTQSPRYTDGYLTGEATDDDNAIPPLLAVQVALLALWYAQNKESFYNRSPAGDDSLCQQLSDLPLSVQTGLWRYVSEEVKIDADQLPATKQDREAGGSLYPTGTEAASTGEAVGTGTIGVDATARATAARAQGTADAAQTEARAADTKATANTNFLSTFMARVVAIVESVVPAWARMPEAPNGGGGGTPAPEIQLKWGISQDGNFDATNLDGTATIASGQTETSIEFPADPTPTNGRSGYYYLIAIPASEDDLLGIFFDVGFNSIVAFRKTTISIDGVDWNVWISKVELRVDGVNEIIVKARESGGAGVVDQVARDAAAAAQMAADMPDVDQAARDAAAAAQAAADAPDVDQVARDAAAAAQMAADAPDVDQTARFAAAAARAAIPAKATNADVDGESDDAGYTTVVKVFRAIARKVKPATTSTAGLIEIATQAEADTGTDTARAMTPALVKRRIDAIPAPTGGGGSAQEWSYELRYLGDPNGMNTELNLTWQSSHSAYASYVALRQAFTDGDIKMILLRLNGESSIAAVAVNLGAGLISGDIFCTFNIGEIALWVTFKSTGATIRFQFNPPTGNQVVNIGVFA